MQKQEIPPFTLCHSRSDLALNQLAVLQAISRPPRRLHECSLNSRGPSWTSLRGPHLMGGRSLLFIQTGRSFHAVQIKEQSGWDRCVSSPLLWVQEGLVTLGDGPSCVLCDLCSLNPPRWLLSLVELLRGEWWYNRTLLCDYPWLRLQKEERLKETINYKHQPSIHHFRHLSRTKWQYFLDPAYQMWGLWGLFFFYLSRSTSWWKINGRNSHAVK